MQQDDLHDLSARSEARSSLLNSIARRQQEAQALMRSVDSMSENSGSGRRAEGEMSQSRRGDQTGISRGVNLNSSMRHIFEQADAASEAVAASLTRRSALWTASAAAAAAHIESSRPSRMFDRLISRAPSDSAFGAGSSAVSGDGVMH